MKTKKEEQKKIEFGTIRYCPYCNAFKPPRAHHCRECNRCVMKMDHHCPWVNNCVGFKNHKTFILFLFYAVMGLIWFLSLLCWRLYHGFVTQGDKEMAFTPVELVLFIVNFILTLPMTLAILSLFVYQLTLVRANLTSVETFHKRRLKRVAMRAGQKNYRWPYDFGSLYNIRSMFGQSVYEWFVPNFSYETDGIVWKTRDSLEAQDPQIEGRQELTQVVEVEARPPNSNGHLNKRITHIVT